jgi:hypothetical protein
MPCESAVTQERSIKPSAWWKRPFDGQGPLSTFSAKIDVAHAFEIIGDDEVSDFHAIRNIRNAFAHTTVPLHFDSPEIASRFQALSGWANGRDIKKLFEERVAACVTALQSHIEVSILTAALQGRSSASELSL